MTSTDAEIRALLGHEKWWDSLTDEEREYAERRRKILGSLDDTAALNRAGL